MSSLPLQERGADVGNTILCQQVEKFWKRKSRHALPACLR